MKKFEIQNTNRPSVEHGTYSTRISPTNIVENKIEILSVVEFWMDGGLEPRNPAFLLLLCMKYRISTSPKTPQL